MKRWKLFLAMLGLVAALVVLGMGCAADKATPTPTPTKAPVATAIPTATPTAAPRATATPTQAVVATPTATNTPAPTVAPKPVVFKASHNFWSKNNPVDDHYSRHIHSLNFDRLLYIDANGALVPQVATSWEEVNNRDWRFKLRNDVKFHDGTPLTAKDVAFMINAALTLPGSNRLGWSKIEKAEAVDDTTLYITQKQRNVFTPADMVNGFIPSKAQVDKDGWEKFNLKPMGSGVWQWKDWISWDHTFAERFPGGHPFRKTIIDRLELYDITVVETGIAALRTGALDFSLNNFFPEQVQDMEKRGFKMNIQGASQPALHLHPLDACALKYPTCDPRVRKAMYLSIDRKALADKLWLGYAIAACQGGSPKAAGWAEDIKDCYDPQKAEQLLEEAGYKKGPDGTRLVIDFYMNWIPGVPDLMAQVITDQWTKVGIKAIYKKVDISVAFRSHYRTDGTPMPVIFQALGLGIGNNDNFYFTNAAYCDDVNAVRCFYPYGNPKFTELQQKVYDEPDAKKREVIIKDLQRLLAEDVPTIPTVVLPTFRLWNPKWANIDGFGNDIIWDDIQLAQK